MTTLKATYFKLSDKYASVGFVRDDGDFELLATFNNSGDFMRDGDFFTHVMNTVNCFNQLGEVDDVVALCREDAVDIVNLD